MTDIPEIEALRLRTCSPSVRTTSGYVVPLPDAEHAIRTALDRQAREMGERVDAFTAKVVEQEPDRQAREIVEALREVYDGFDHEKIAFHYGLAYKEAADFIEGRFVRKDESDG